MFTFKIPVDTTEATLFQSDLMKSTISYIWLMLLTLLQLHNHQTGKIILRISVI